MKEGNTVERFFRPALGVLRTWATDTRLDPRKAVTITMLKLYELADHAEEMKGIEDADTLIRVPRIPTNTAEARAMIALTNCADG